MTTTKEAATRYSISAVSRLTGKSRSTIQRDLKLGRLSYVSGPNGSKLIDASELARAYSDSFDVSSGQGASTNPLPGGEMLKNELDAVRGELEMTREERRREREHLLDQIDHLRDSLRLAQEGQNRVTKLLEDRTVEGGAQSPTMRYVDEQLAVQQAEIARWKEEVASEAGRRAIDELKELPWWSALRKLVFS